jgi:ABC-type branched-subunit amino acid transport system ATPase component
VTIVGPNGAGKTTLLKAISGSVTAQAGRILYRGGDLGALRPSDRAALGSRTSRKAAGSSPR